MTHLQTKRLGQAVQVGDCLYIVNDKNEVWRLGASENLHRPGSFTFIVHVPKDWTDAELVNCIEAYAEVQFKAHQAARHKANHELSPCVPKSKVTGRELCRWCSHPESRGKYSMPARCICGTNLG